MAATKIEITFGSHSKEIQHATWEDTERAIKAIDGTAQDGVVVETSDGSYLGVVGNTEGKYVVAGRLANGRPFILASGERAGKTYHVCVGGQENEYADYELTSLPTALVVARTFFDQGLCDGRFVWNERPARS